MFIKSDVKSRPAGLNSLMFIKSDVKSRSAGLNSLMFIKSDVKSRSAGAGSFDRLRINSFDKLRASSPATYGFEEHESWNSKRL